MLLTYEKKANIAAAIWFSSVFVLAALFPLDEGKIWDEPNRLALLVFLVHIVSFVFTLWAYAVGKGYSGILGIALGFLYLLGLLVLFFLRDKNRQSDDDVTLKETTHKKHWVIYLFILCISIFGYTLVSERTDGDTIYFGVAFLVGYYFLAAAVSALIFRNLFTKGSGAVSTSIVFFAILGSFVIGSLISVETKHAENVAGLEYMVDQMEELYDLTSQTNEDGALKLVDQTFSPSVDASGSMAVMQQFMADIANQSAALSNNYVLELDSMGWQSILDMSRLQSDTSFEESRRLLADARLLITKYQNRQDELLVINKRKIQYLDLSAAKKEAMEKGFMRGVRSSATFREGIWNLEEATLDEFEKVIDLLADDPQGWSMNSSQILFESQQQADQFNIHLENIDSFAAEQIEIKRAAVEANRKQIDEYR